MLTMMLTAMIAASGASADGASVGVQVGGYVLGTCRARETVVTQSGFERTALTPSCAKNADVSISTEVADAGKDGQQVIRIRVTPR